MAQYTLKNGKMMLSTDAAKKSAEYHGKRRAQGEKAAKELDAKTAPKS